MGKRFQSDWAKTEQGVWNGFNERDWLRLAASLCRFVCKHGSDGNPDAAGGSSGKSQRTGEASTGGQGRSCCRFCKSKTGSDCRCRHCHRCSRSQLCRGTRRKQSLGQNCCSRKRSCKCTARSCCRPRAKPHSGTKEPKSSFDNGRDADEA